MSEAHPEWSDQAIEEAVAALLRTGLQLATTLVLVGAAIYLVRHGSEQPEYRIFHGELPTLRGLRGIIAVSMDWRGRGLIMLGLLVLLATPVARVAFCMFAFTMQRDRLYVGITFVVLTVLLYSIVGGYM
jgi:uncharacterized membrane protein